MKRDERGYIVVETIGSFLLFVFLVTSILSLINIVTVQARIHYALTQTAETVSMYTYALERAGLAEHLQANAKKSEKVEQNAADFKKNVNGVIDSIESLSIGGVKASGGAALNQIKEFGGAVQKNPEAIFKDFLNCALNEAIDAAFAAAVEPLLNHYLSNGQMSGDAFLRRFGVIDGINGIELNEIDLIDVEGNRFVTENRSSAFLTGDGDVKIVARYKVDYTFGALPLPFSELEIRQEVMTKSWLSGLGEGYTE